jgi:hypothetical protein
MQVLGRRALELVVRDDKDGEAGHFASFPLTGNRHSDLFQGPF